MLVLAVLSWARVAVPLESLRASASNQDASPVPAWLASASGTTDRLRSIAATDDCRRRSFMHTSSY
jgi:hypothetical protein